MEGPGNLVGVVRRAQGTAQPRTWVAMVTSRSALIGVSRGFLQREIDIKQVLHVWGREEIDKVVLDAVSVSACTVTSCIIYMDHKEG